MPIEVKPVIQVKSEEVSAKKIDIETTNSKTAVIICHGMGQQVKFETLSLVSEIILANENINVEENRKQEAKVRLINYGGMKIPRAELTIKDNKGKDRNIDLYEIYWAPVAEGRINAWQTLNFLFSSAKEGIIFSLKGSFQRRMFGSKKKLIVKHYTWFIILIVLILLITFSLLFFFNIFILFVSIIGWVYGFDSQSVILPVVRLYPLLFFESLIENNYNLFLVINLILALILLKGKSILKQYVGDVVAYVSPYKLSKFAKIRTEIQKQGLDLAKFVYGLKKDKLNGTFEYDKIIIVGHSLGSVIAYDTLNAIINEYMTPEGNSSAAERTKLLLTFGSPLDKTAFIFRTQKDELPVREALAEATQPLINKYEYRPDSWINIYSFMDIISGELDYYDDPDLKQSFAESKNYWNKRIKNIVDWTCWIPLAAHNQYWKKKELAKALIESLKN